MSNAAKYSALGFSALCFGLAVDATVGIGTAQWLADLCLTDAGDDMSDMVMATVKPGPLLALSMGFAGLGMWLLLAEDKKLALGLSEPTTAEQAGILSAIILAAVENGRTTEYEIAHVYEIVTGHALHEEMAWLAFDRFQTFDPDAADKAAPGPVDTPLARRRILAAALMTGCVIGSASPGIAALIEHLSLNIGATPDDVTAANTALQNWMASDSGLNGAPLVTLLRTKPLGLRPV
ncbi:MAG: hypothetical protein HKN18_07220 [Silicimonas sp.]|nr:hypothetical protein [Silicimonas sp.]